MFYGNAFKSATETEFRGYGVNRPACNIAASVRSRTTLYHFEINSEISTYFGRIFRFFGTKSIPAVLIVVQDDIRFSEVLFAGTFQTRRSKFW